MFCIHFKLFLSQVTAVPCQDSKWKYTSIEFVIDKQFNDIDTALEAQYNKVKLEDNKFRVNTVGVVYFLCFIFFCIS